MLFGYFRSGYNLFMTLLSPVFSLWHIGSLLLFLFLHFWVFVVVVVAQDVLLGMLMYIQNTLRFQYK